MVAATIRTNNWGSISREVYNLEAFSKFHIYSFKDPPKKCCLNSGITFADSFLTECLNNFVSGCSNETRIANNQ